MKAVSPAVLSVLLAGLVSPGLIGCKQGQLEPEFAPSTDQASYAKEHPADLKAAAEGIDTQIALVDTLSSEFKEYPDQLKDPDWESVGTVVDQADVEGQSPHYAASIEDNDKVAAFYEEEKDELHKRVGGAVQYQVKEKGCDVDGYSAAAVAMDKAMQKRLEERTRSHSEAHSFIRMHESKLGKANVEPLEHQADRIALGSYVSHVGLVKKKNELDRLLADASAVDSTLKSRIEELKSAPPDEKLSPNEKKAREEELAALEEAKASLAAELEPAKQKATDAEQRINAAKQKYADALAQLKSTIDERASNASKEAASKSDGK